MNNEKFITYTGIAKNSSDIHSKGLQKPSISRVDGNRLVRLKNGMIYSNQVMKTKIISSSCNYADIDNVDTSKTLVFNETMVELVANWFLNICTMSNKKLQKLCYYAYCWYIVFNNDVEDIEMNSTSTIKTLFPETFQAWIHGPVQPRLYQKYKKYGWHDIPKEDKKVKFNTELEDLLKQVWDAYGNFSGDELELISHKETPWIKSREGCLMDVACYNEISKKDILEYYSGLGK